MTDQQDLRARLLVADKELIGAHKHHETIREAAAQLGQADEAGYMNTERDETGALHAYATRAECLNHCGSAVPYYLRPQLPAGAPEYDRELIAEMLTDERSMPVSSYSREAINEQVNLLRAADNRDAEGVHTAKGEVSVPDGWVLVPREPTPEMLRAGFLSESEGFDIETPSDAPGLVYRAMLAAATQPDNKESR